MAELLNARPMELPELGKDYPCAVVQASIARILGGSTKDMV